MAWATAGILVATIGNIIVSCNQRDVMRAQLQEMRQANERAIRDGAKAAADTQSALAISKGQLASMQGQLESFKLSNRASVAISRLEIDFGGRSGGTIKIWLINVGRAPATNVVMYSQVGWYPVAVVNVPAEPMKDSERDFGKASLPPGPDPFFISLPLGFTETHLRDVRAGIKGVLFSGIIKYSDGFGIAPSTDLCFWYQSEHGGAWGRCTPRISYTDTKDLERQIKEQQEKAKAGSRR